MRFVSPSRRTTPLRHATPHHTISHLISCYLISPPHPDLKSRIGKTHLKDPPLPIHLDDLFLPDLDLGLDLFRLRFELIVPDQPGVGAVGGEEGEVFVPGQSINDVESSRSEVKQESDIYISISLARSSAPRLNPFCRMAKLNLPPVQHAQPDPSFPLGLLPVFGGIPFFRPERVPLGRVDRLGRL